ncbi:transglutaminase domain-containing protein [Leptolyngbya sp. FACHB-16]|uniref:transglutaminase domain-containing protein n=1 Tax=unclassified Leptolyngbya TaxID=2650499 RepID=UPI0016880864|nr:transglutaminase domain-containing protein [Leptolyngbya sp. FACHB-16]MBD2156558.1 transglutaminase [Leptolyngbya sp. FACHB-16]
MRFLLLHLPIALLRFSFYFFVFSTPILGVWLASSLVAYANGPVWLVLFSGILLFPLIPIIWDLWGRRKQKTPGVLTWGDRITLRTLLLNLVFITCLLALRPQTSFLALATRGDWMLDGRQGAGVEMTRKGLFYLANQLEWLYLSFHHNPFQQYANSSSIQVQPTPNSTSIPTPKPSQAAREWPWERVSLHPAIATMPASVETSIESVAQYIVQQEKDPFQRVKALHDYVADRIAYDAPSYFAGQYPPQDAETVFQRRTAVCAGYAKLLEALGKAAGEEILYVVGDSRSQTSDLNGQSHAWNAAKINGVWYLIDATWNSGYVDSSGFTKQYKTSYLFPPPHAMVISHFPDDPSWQLLPRPLSRGEFLRQPMLRPQFFADGLKLVFPTRSQTDVQGNALLQIENPRQKWLMASYRAKADAQAQNCLAQPIQGSQISCSFPETGTYEVSLFSGGEQAGRYDYVGQVEFNRS